MKCVGVRAAVLFISLCLAIGAQSQASGLCGLVTMGKVAPVMDGQPPSTEFEELFAHPRMYNGAVVLAGWAMLEPTQGHYDFSSIDTALLKLAQYNKRYPKFPVAAKLRIFAGTVAPDWAKTLDGSPVELIDDGGDVKRVGKFWAPSYRAAWRLLQAALARKYETQPLVKEVAVNSCSTLSGEPFVLSLDPVSRGNLVNSGFTDSSYQSCLNSAIDDYAPWKSVNLDYSINPFYLRQPAQVVLQTSFSLDAMTAWRTAYGTRAVLSNHGLNNPLKPVAGPIYDKMRSLRGRIAFQTLAPVGVAAAVDFALHDPSLKPSVIELWDSKDAGGPGDFTIDDLRRWRGLMKANCIP